MRLLLLNAALRDRRIELAWITHVEICSPDLWTLHEITSAQVFVKNKEIMQIFVMMHEIPNVG